MPADQGRLPEADANEHRMAFGDHLEELRRRIIYALWGLLATMIFCFYFGDRLIVILTTPYTVAMEEQGFDPRMLQLNPTEAFMEYCKISFEFAVVLAAPWMLYQIWGFVATGLYASEKRVVRYFAPASIGLFLTGASFMVMIVLSGLLKFLISISTWMPLPNPDSALYKWMRGKTPPVMVATVQPTSAPCVPMLVEDPPHPREGEAWISGPNRRFTIYSNGEKYFVPLQQTSSNRFVQPFFSISEYLGFVVNLAMAFGLGFQIPIVVVFLAAMNIIKPTVIAGARRYVIVGVLILAAVITPTPDIPTMMLLAVPMLLLFEAGLLIAKMNERNKLREESEPRP